MRLLFTCSLMAVTAVGQGNVTVPFVGCAETGQTGAIAAPKGRPVRVNLSAKVAGELAYYQAGGFVVGVLAPRGWQCQGLSGSGGAFLVVLPSAGELNHFLTQPHELIRGPVVRLSFGDARTSGRFGVAQVVARVFPKYISFTKEVQEAFGQPESEYPTGPPPGDRVTRRSDEAVRFETPAGQRGLGTTDYSLAPGDRPIQGSMILDASPTVTGLATVSVRLPEEKPPLVEAILARFEEEMRPGGRAGAKQRK